LENVFYFNGIIARKKKSEVFTAGFKFFIQMLGAEGDDWAVCMMI